MIEWFADYRDVISGIAGIATAIGLLATSITLVVAAMQIRAERRLNRANAMYLVQSDARALTWQLTNDPVLAHAVFGKAPDKAKLAIGTVVNYYSAVFQLWQHDVLDDSLWSLFATDFAAILKVDQTKKHWEAIKGNFDSRFVGEMEARLMSGDGQGR